MVVVAVAPEAAAVVPESFAVLFLSRAPPVLSPVKLLAEIARAFTLGCVTVMVLPPPFRPETLCREKTTVVTLVLLGEGKSDRASMA